MIVTHFLRKFPNISKPICFWGQPKFTFCDKVNHFICRYKIPGVKVKTTLASPYNHLAHRKTGDYILSILKKTVLYTPFMIIKNGSIFWDNTHHLRKTFSLPLYVLIVRHTITMMTVPFL